MAIPQIQVGAVLVGRKPKIRMNCIVTLMLRIFTY